jgi:glycosyltransferase involved in cell wall biosynthesis
MISLSAVIITYNEAHNIARCLTALQGVVEEIVILDSFSTDDTEAICRSFKVRFEQHTFDGFGAQKHRAVLLARFDHVLCLDADEVLSEALRNDILATKQSWTHAGYQMNRLSNYCGYWVHHSGWYPDRKLRLFDRRQAQWNTNMVHESVQLQPQATTGLLRGDLLHYTYSTVAEHRARATRYAQLAARSMREKGQRPNWFKRHLSPPFRFFRHYVLQLGFLDGWAGWHIARMAMLENKLKYNGEWRMENGKWKMENGK